MADAADTKQVCLTIFQLQLTEILYSFIDSFYTYAYLIIHINHQDTLKQLSRF